VADRVARRFVVPRLDRVLDRHADAACADRRGRPRDLGELGWLHFLYFLLKGVQPAALRGFLVAQNLAVDLAAGVLGSSLTNSTMRGNLVLASRSRVKSCSL
jgi:hypothetical protein